MLHTLPIHLAGSASFDAALSRLAARGGDDLEAVAPAVREILAAVRAEGDAAVRRYVERFERRTVGALVRTDFDGAAALARLEASHPGLGDGLAFAAERIERFHRRQRDAELAGASFRYEEDGITLGMRTRPIARVGVYAPGGKARYPSSVLMAAIPARVAGVREIVLATPAPDDRLLAAAHLAGVTSVLDAGGAHAIAALAYGTATLRRVDKIVGPGNAYVACAKKLVFGDVAIDSIAGPSEILVLADGDADPALVAADLLSQAEHDEAAYAILVTTSGTLATAVAAEATAQLGRLSRREIAGASIRDHGVILVVPDEDALVEAAEVIAAEHVSFHLAEPERVMDRIGAIGAALLGAFTPVAVGDYLAGPSHVLPTGGGVRFGSPLGVHDFVARSSVLRYSAEALARQGATVALLARAEGLEAHALAVEARFPDVTRTPGPSGNHSQTPNAAAPREDQEHRTR
jgi:histidinol dehydrogenase